MKEANITMGEMKPAKFALILTIAFVFSLMIANVLQFVVIHQMSLASIVNGLPQAEQDAFLTSTMQKYGHQFTDAGDAVVKIREEFYKILNNYQVNIDL